MPEEIVSLSICVLQSGNYVLLQISASIILFFKPFYKISKNHFASKHIYKNFDLEYTIRIFTKLFNKYIPFSKVRNPFRIRKSISLGAELIETSRSQILLIRSESGTSKNSFTSPSLLVGVNDFGTSRSNTN